MQFRQNSTTFLQFHFDHNSTNSNAAFNAHYVRRASDYTASGQTSILPTDIDDEETNKTVLKYIAEEINLFENHLAKIRQRSMGLNVTIGTKEEMKNAHQQLNNLQDIIDQAVESTDALTTEIQTLKLSFEETYSMATEANTNHLANMNSEYLFILLCVLV